MGKLLINRDNLVDNGTIEGLGATPLLPLANLLSSRLEYPWRSATTDLADTSFDISLPYAYPLRVVALIDTNASTAVKIRARAFDDGLRTTTVFDTGWVESGSRVPFGEIGFSGAGAFTGFLPWNDPWRKPPVLLLLPEPFAAMFWRIEVDDQENLQGYFQSARLWMSRYISPRFNFSPDAGFGIRNNTREQIGFLGQKRRQRRAFDPRRFSFQIQYLDEQEAMDEFYDLNMRTGFSGEALIITDDGATGLDLQRKTFLGLIEEASPFSLQAPDYAHVGYTFEETIR